MDKSPDESPSPRSRPTSRRSSVSLPRKNSAKKEKDRKPSSAHSTPKKTVKPAPEFLVTGKQILKKSDRANSLPGSTRRQSVDQSGRKKVEPKKTVQKSKEETLEDDMSLDLSQVSDFEDLNSKYGLTQKFNALATSTPKPKPRSASLQSQMQTKVKTNIQKSLDGKSRESTFSNSRDSYLTSSSNSPHRYATDLDYSSVSPEYSGQSSTDLSPRVPTEIATPKSLLASSCCVSSWQDSDPDTKVEDREGEWAHFWANYNNSLSKVPMKSYYDQCPTPYRSENIDFCDFDLSTEETKKRSPNNIKNIHNVIRNEGLQLTPRETQNMIKCAHILGNVLSKAIERRSKETQEAEIEEIKETEDKKKNLTLPLKETTLPVKVEEEKRSETATTQTDISLPNTKSAPRIFEHILRQLSKSSIDEENENQEKDETKVVKTAQ